MSCPSVVHSGFPAAIKAPSHLVAAIAVQSESLPGPLVILRRCRFAMDDKDLPLKIDDLVEGDQDAAKWLVDRYYVRLVNLAKRKLGAMPPQVADDEGAVISAFRSFFSGVRVGQFPKLDDRDDLWKVLATLTTRKAVAQIRHHWRKRGEAGNGRNQAAVDEIASCQPTPDEAASFLEECQARIDALTDDRLREIVLLRLQGWDTDQIADKLQVHRRTVQRKLALVEREWRDQIET